MTEKDPNDNLLIDRYLSGDENALRSLVKKWHLTFCEKAYWILKDKSLSKDVAQDSWISIIRNLNTLKNKDHFKSWALRIVYTKSINAYNKRKMETSFDGTTIGDKVEDSPVENKQRSHRLLLQTIQKLPKAKQDVIRLFYLEQYSIQEIAGLLGIPKGTVKSRLFAAREHLKDKIKLFKHEE